MPKYCQLCYDRRRYEFQYDRTKKYKATDKARETRKAWNRTEKQRAYKAAYQQSDAGKAAAARHHSTDRYRIKRRAYFHERHRGTDPEDLRRFYDTAHSEKWPCNNCSTTYETNYEVDHIVPLGMGGTNDWDNLQLLCPTCHKAKTKVDVRKIREYKGETSNTEASI
jgi:5-methylcytosine-specific restriction endonuclease McrA